MVFALAQLREQRSLQSDGIPSQEISSASNIMAISSLPRNLNSLPFIACALISYGMMLYRTGKNKRYPLEVLYTFTFFSLAHSTYFLFLEKLWPWRGTQQRTNREGTGMHQTTVDDTFVNMPRQPASMRYNQTIGQILHPITLFQRW